jgi:type IV secretory pathway protease TraF
MLPTLSPGEYVLFDRLAYRREAPRRGDVVLAEQPGTGLLVVKRVAGAPGERVAVAGREWTLAEDEYLLLGDDPEVSRDSRDWGPVARAAVLARAWLVYWPPARMRRVRG